MGDCRRITQYVSEAETVPVDATVADVAARGAQRFPIAVVDEAGVLLGTVAPNAAALPTDTPVDQVMDPAPGTIRPEMRIEEVVEQLRSDGLDQVLVTAVNGVLIGRAVAEELHV